MHTFEGNLKCRSEGKERVHFENDFSYLVSVGWEL